MAFINAWILAKIMLVAESLDVRPHFRGRPLVYPILARRASRPIKQRVPNVRE